MDSWRDVMKKLALATVETIGTLTPVQTVLVSTGIDRLGDLLFGLQNTQDQIGTALARIEGELHQQSLAQFHTALRDLRAAFPTKRVAQRRVLLNNARERLTYVAELQSLPALLRAQALCYVGLCDDALGEPATALLGYQEAYAVAQQDESIQAIQTIVKAAYVGLDVTGISTIDKMMTGPRYYHPDAALLTTKQKAEFGRSYDQAKEALALLTALSHLLAARGSAAPDDTLRKMEAVRTAIAFPGPGLHLHLRPGDS